MRLLPRLLNAPVKEKLRPLRQGKESNWPAGVGGVEGEPSTTKRTMIALTSSRAAGSRRGALIGSFLIGYDKGADLSARAQLLHAFERVHPGVCLEAHRRIEMPEKRTDGN